MEKVAKAYKSGVESIAAAADLPAADSVASIAIENASIKYTSFSSPLAVIGVRESRPPNSDFHSAQLHELNRTFLYLLRAEALASTTDTNQGLSAAAMQLLLQLSADSVKRAADCPYALFDVNALINTATCGVSHVCDTDDRGAMPRALRLQFANAVLFYAWHELRILSTRARLRFGLDADAARALRAAAPSELAAWANHAKAVRPRCVQHLQFWPALLQRAESNDAQGLRAAFWLGQQLVSGEMHRH